MRPLSQWGSDPLPQEAQHTADTENNVQYLSLNVPDPPRDQSQTFVMYVGNLLSNFLLIHKEEVTLTSFSSVIIPF